MKKQTHEKKHLPYQNTFKLNGGGGGGGAAADDDDWSPIQDRRADDE